MTWTHADLSVATGPRKLSGGKHSRKRKKWVSKQNHISLFSLCNKRLTNELVKIYLFIYCQCNTRWSYLGKGRTSKGNINWLKASIRLSINNYLGFFFSSSFLPFTLLFFFLFECKRFILIWLIYKSYTQILCSSAFCFRSQIIFFIPFPYSYSKRIVLAF